MSIYFVNIGDMVDKLSWFVSILDIIKKNFIYKVVYMNICYL